MPAILRFVYRFLWLAGALTLAALDYLFTSARCAFRPTQQHRTLWLHRASVRVLRVFVSRVETAGILPRPGLLVSNHLSYVDILLLGSVVPAVFVSKSEVKDWPVFGWFSRVAGTIFVERGKRADVGRISAEIAAHLRNGHVVVLFPEGTSSDGRDVLPFRSSLLEPVTGAQHDLFAAHLAYSLPDGSVENDVCYWGDMTFFPHLVKLLGKPRASARVRFSEVAAAPDCRKTLARQLHEEVRKLKAAHA